MKSFIIGSSSLVITWLASTIPSSTSLVTFQAKRKASLFGQNRVAHCSTTKLHGVKGTADDSTISSTATATTIALSADEGGRPGTATLDVPWEELGFEFRRTKSHLSMTYKDGLWGPMELHQVSVSASQRKRYYFFPYRESFHIYYLLLFHLNYYI